MSSEEEPVVWLRAQVEADLALARRLAARWVAPADHPTRGGEAIWPASSVEALMVFRGEDPDVNAGLDLIRLCSPAYVIARCEAELAILDACVPGENAEAALEAGDISAEEYVTAEAMGTGIVRLLASGYRHRRGYREEWKP